MKKILRFLFALFLFVFGINESGATSVNSAGISEDQVNIYEELKERINPNYIKELGEETECGQKNA